MTTHWKAAWDDHKALIIIGGIYIVMVLAEALSFGVPPHELLRIFGYLFMATIIALAVLTLVYLGAFLRFFGKGEGGFLARWLQASRRLDLAARAYMSDRRWTYACLGFLAMAPTNFFFIAKSLIPVVNPYAKMKWDMTFAAWDRSLHFGHYPHDLVIPFINELHAAHILDAAYAFWLVIMMGFSGFNLFFDRHVRRRLRFLFVYIISWIILGSFIATGLSSTGPLFFHDFFPDANNPYKVIGDNLDTLGAQGFYFVSETRHMLLQWANNGRIFNPNAVSAMPSMHVAIAWLIVLYMREVGRVICAFTFVFFLIVFVSTLYFGLHYGIDGYVSVAAVTLLWWLAGKYINPRHGRAETIGGEI